MSVVLAQIVAQVIDPIKLLFAYLIYRKPELGCRLDHGCSRISRAVRCCRISVSGASLRYSNNSQPDWFSYRLCSSQDVRAKTTPEVFEARR